MNIKKISAVVLVLLILLVSYFVSGFILLKLGSHYYSNKQYTEAGKVYRLVIIGFPWWNLPKERMNNLNEIINQENQIKQYLANTITLQSESIVIDQKRILPVSMQGVSKCSGLMVTAIFKNSLDIGIPLLKINRINLLKNGTLMATKTSLGEFFLVANGEFPFKRLFCNNDNNIFDFDDFNFEVEIPPFIPNNNVVSLEVKNIKLTSLIVHENGASYYKYKITVANENEFRVNNVYRISFLKYKGYSLDSYGSTGGVYLLKGSDNKDYVDLDKDKQYERLSLGPKEKKEIEISLMIDLPFKGHYDPNKVDLVTYFTGVRE